MKIDLQLDKEQQKYLDNLRERRDDLVVPIEPWEEFIKNENRISPEDFPEHMVVGAYVLTPRDWFEQVVADLPHLYCSIKRLTKAQGGVWFVEKLEPKKRMPNYDIFKVGRRAPGSFRSKG